MNQTKVKNVDGMVGEGVEFERIRRITGYLVGDTKRFNSGKKAELYDRVKHSVTPQNEGRRRKKDEW